MKENYLKPNGILDNIRKNLNLGVTLELLRKCGLL